MVEKKPKPTIEIKLVNVHKTYYMGEVDVKVLRGIDLEIHAQELTVIQGDSGAGKTTLLNMIGGIDRPTSGEIWFEGKDIAQLSDGELTLYRRKSVGFVFQFYNLVSTLTALENVEVSTEIVDDPMDPGEALKHVDLADRMGHFPAQLSGGQQQRVAIARALAKNPNLMLCDEPTGALDTETSVNVLNLLTDLNRKLGTAIVLITHNPQIAKIANRVIHLGDGKVEKAYVNEKPIKAEDISW